MIKCGRHKCLPLELLHKSIDDYDEHKPRISGSNTDRSQEFKLNWKDRVASIFSGLKASRKTLLLIVIVAIVSIASTSIINVPLSNSSSEIYTPSIGTIKTTGFEAFSDSAYQQEELEWAEIELGASISRLVYIKSSAT